VCQNCKNVLWVDKRAVTNLCRSCCQSGDLNHAWRGGHKGWQKGKLGRDKDGLSWKHQRVLVWERDNYTCQDCGKSREDLGRRPDVDHIVPYRISASHALENLITRCRSCHKKAEAKRTELWGGKTWGGSPPASVSNRCSNCGRIRVLNLDDNCNQCDVELNKIPKARELRNQGSSYDKIADILCVRSPTVRRWLSDKPFSERRR
jgi:hypothetical protein